MTAPTFVPVDPLCDAGIQQFVERTGVRVVRLLRIKLTCPVCSVPLRLMTALTDPDSSPTCLAGASLDSRPQLIALARLIPEPELDFVA